jgi:putative Mg2+ transporter-C (MgtC) family protein
MKRHTKAGVPLTRAYRVQLTCLPQDETAMRALILGVLTTGGLHISEIAASGTDGMVTLSATVTGEGISDQALEQAVQRMGMETGVARLRWEPTDEG